MVKIYQKKLKQKLLRFIRQSNKEFRKKSERVEMYLRERKELVLLHSLHSYAERKHLTLPTRNEKFYFLAYMMFFSKSKRFALENPAITKTKRPYYKQLNEMANRYLSSHIMQTIVNSWHKDVKRVQEFKAKMTGKAIYGFFRAL